MSFTPSPRQHPFALDLGDSKQLGTEDKHQGQVLQAGDRGGKKPTGKRSMLKQT